MCNKVAPTHASFDYASLPLLLKASDRRKLERINERGLHVVFNDWNLPYEDLLRRARLTTLFNKRLQDIAILMYKVKNDLVPRTVLDLFNQGTSHNYNLRNADFSTQRFNTIKYGKHTLSYFGPYLWSRLSNKLRLLSTLTSFKSAIRKIDLDSLSSTCANCVLCNS